MQPHPRDARITFDPEPHTYLVDGVEYTSVTSVIKSFFNDFDAENMAAKCAGRGKYRNMTAEEVRTQWRENADDSARKGTAFHQSVEDYLTHGEVTNHPDFHAWNRWWQGAKTRMGRTVRLEWAIFDEEHRIAGTLDALFQSPRDQFFLMDWKRKRRMAKRAWRSDDTGLAPLDQLPNCDFTKASLQLNTYRWILRRHYNIEIGAMGLVQVHPECGLQTHRVDCMQVEVEAMLTTWKQRQAEKPQSDCA